MTNLCRPFTRALHSTSVGLRLIFLAGLLLDCRSVHHLMTDSFVVTCLDNVLITLTFSASNLLVEGLRCGNTVYLIL